MRRTRASSSGGRSNTLWGRGSRNESRSNALWGRGGRRVAGIVAVLAISCSLAAAASAGTAGGHGFWGFNVQGMGRTSAYIPDSLASAILQDPRQRFDVIVEGVQTPQDPSQQRVTPVGLKGGLLGSQRGANTIWGSQIRELYQSIDGLHATLSGFQIQFLARMPFVAAIVPNDTVQVTSTGSYLWNPQKWAWTIGAPVDWMPKATQLSAPTIAIIDSGIDATRADFGNRVLGQVNFTGSSSPGDGYGHGTFVAGIAAGAAHGYAGVTPSADLLSLKVINDQGQATVATVVAACDWVLQNKAAYNIRVANLSLHAASPGSLFFDPLDQAVEKLWLNGVVVVAAAGNYSSNGQESGVPYAPGNDPFVITVGAADIENTIPTGDDLVAPWSAWGYTPDGFLKPDISAPGRYLIGPVSQGTGLALGRPSDVVAPGYMELSGTSFSAPMVAGAAAMLLAQHPSWTPDQVKGALMVSANPTPAATPDSLGVGELNVYRAEMVSNPPNPNAGLDQFLTTRTDGTVTFDSAAWQTAALANPAWGSTTWSDAAWATAAWSDAAWASAAWASAAWSDAAWASAATSDAAWADSAGNDTTLAPASTDATPTDITTAEQALGIDPTATTSTTP